MNKTKYFSLFLLLMLNSCITYWEHMQNYLLPANCKISKIDQFKDGITTYLLYMVDGKIDLDSLKYYPKETYYTKPQVYKKWHKLDSIEVKNMKALFKLHRINTTFSQRILRAVEEGKNYVLSYRIKTSKSVPFLNEVNYDPTHWITILYIDIDAKKLYIIDHGEF